MMLIERTFNSYVRVIILFFSKLVIKYTRLRRYFSYMLTYV